MPATEKKRRKRERKDGRIQIELELPKGPDGKRRRKYFYGATKAEAVEKRDLYIREYGYSFVPNIDMTVDQWAARWFRDYKANVRNKTRDWYANALFGHILPRIGHRNIDEILPIDIQTIYNTVEGKSFSLIDSIRATLIQMFDAAVDNDIIKKNPAAKVKPPKGTKCKREAISHGQIRLIASNWGGHRVGIWAMIMLYAGLRRAEMAALRWENINFGSGKLSVEGALEWDNNNPEDSDTKSEAGVREVPMPPILINALETFPAVHRTGLVCRSAKGMMLTVSAYRRGWESFTYYLYNLLSDDDKLAYEAMGLVREIDDRSARKDGTKRKVLSMTAHQLRHAFATMCFEAGIDVKTCSKWMGHKDIETTLKIYTHLSEEQEARSIIKWNEYWEQW